MLIFGISFLTILGFIIFKPAKLSEGLISLISLILLIIFGLLNLDDVRNGLLGNELFRPFEIIIILVSLSIISTTLDQYGFFKHVAYKAILFSKNNGHILFRNFIILTALVTAFTSNDIDILTITPIVLWFASISQINPIPYLFAVFAVANTSSLALLIGNLTNIIIGSIFKLHFVEFFLLMILPQILIILAQYFIIKLIFKKQLPKQILKKEELKEIEKTLEKPLENKKENYFAIIILFLIILGSILSDILPIDIWQISLIGAVILLVSGFYNLKERIEQIPWNVVIFVFAFITLTYKLENLGIIKLIANNFKPIFSSFWGSLFFSSYMSAIASGVINNIPASISASSIFYSLSLGSGDLITKAIAYGTVIGTNLGALFSPVGALATIMWLNLIRKKSYNLTLKKFMPLGILIGSISIFIATTVIGLELLLIN